MAEIIYGYTHITWRTINDDDTISNLVHVIHDRERAADEIKELALNPRVFALRAIHYGIRPGPGAEAEDSIHARLPEAPPVD